MGEAATSIGPEGKSSTPESVDSTRGRRKKVADAPKASSNWSGMGAGFKSGSATALPKTSLPSKSKMPAKFVRSPVQISEFHFWKCRIVAEHIGVHAIVVGIILGGLRQVGQFIGERVAGALHVSSGLPVPQSGQSCPEAEPAR